MNIKDINKDINKDIDKDKHLILSYIKDEKTIYNINKKLNEHSTFMNAFVISGYILFS